MAFPVGNSVTTTNLASGTSNPAAARTDLYTMAVYVNQMIASADSALGIPLLSGSGAIKSTQIPATLAPTGTLNLSPSNGFVKINNILRLQIIPKATLLTTADVVIGDVALYADDLTGANAGVAVYDGTHWKILGALSTLTNLS